MNANSAKPTKPDKPEVPPCPVPGCGGECYERYATGYATNDPPKIVQCAKCYYQVPLAAHRQMCARGELVKKIERYPITMKTPEEIADNFSRLQVEARRIEGV